MINVKKLMAACAAIALATTSMLPMTASAVEDGTTSGTITMALEVKNPQPEYEANDEFTVAVKITDVTGYGVNSWHVLVKYDHASFECTDIYLGSYGSYYYADKNKMGKTLYANAMKGVAGSQLSDNPVDIDINWTYGEATNELVMAKYAATDKPGEAINTAFNFTDTGEDGEVALLTFKVLEGATPGNKTFDLSFKGEPFRTYGTKTAPGDDNVKLTGVAKDVEVKIKDNVVVVPVESVNVTPETKTIKTGEEFSLTTDVVPATATNKSVTYTSSDAKVATVDSTGKVKGVGVGSATITATTADGGKTDTCVVTVEPVAVTGVELDKNTMTLTKGEKGKLTPTVLPAGATVKDVTWSSDKPEIATVDASGNVTGVAVGEANITATTVDGGKTATCKVTVTPVYANEIELDQGYVTFKKIGDNVKVNAVVLPANADDKSVKFTSSDPSIATVSEDGVITAVKPGNTTIVASVKDGPNETDTLDASVIVTVLEAAMNEDADKSVAEGDAAQIPVTINEEGTTFVLVDENNKVVKTLDVKTVEGNTVVEIPENVDAGVYKIKIKNAKGEIVKDATGAEVYVNCEVTPLVDYTGITGDSVTLIRGEKIDAPVINKKVSSVTFSSDNDKVASVDANGVITANGKGTATITAVATFKNGDGIETTRTYTTEVNVNDDFKVQFDPETLNLKVGDVTTLKLKVTTTSTDANYIKMLNEDFGNLDNWNVKINYGGQYIDLDTDTWVLLGKIRGDAQIVATNRGYIGEDLKERPIYCNITVEPALPPYNTPNYGAKTDFAGPREVVGNNVQVRVTDSTASGSPIAATGGEFDTAADNAAAIAAGALGVIALGFVVVARKKRRS